MLQRTAVPLGSRTVRTAVARQLDFVPARLGWDVDPKCVGLIWVIDDAVDSVFNSARIDDVETRVFVPIRFHGQQEPGSIGRDVGDVDRNGRLGYRSSG